MARPKSSKPDAFSTNAPGPMLSLPGLPGHETRPQCLPVAGRCRHCRCCRIHGSRRYAGPASCQADRDESAFRSALFQSKRRPTKVWQISHTFQKSTQFRQLSLDQMSVEELGVNQLVRGDILWSELDVSFVFQALCHFSVINGLNWDCLCG